MARKLHFGGQRRYSRDEHRPAIAHAESKARAREAEVHVVKPAAVHVDVRDGSR